MSRTRCPVCTVVHSPHCQNDRRWPLEPLADLTPASTTVDIARIIGVSHQAIRWARIHGLSDTNADRWAIRCGFHPAQVWPDWIDAALTVVDRQRLDGGWRPAWEHAEPAPARTKEAA